MKRLTVPQVKMILEPTVTATKPTTQPVPAVQPADLLRFARGHEEKRKQMFDELCELHKLEPRALAMLPPRTVRDMILAARPNIARQPLEKQMAVLADDKIQQRLDEWYREKLAVKG